ARRDVAADGAVGDGQRRARIAVVAEARLEHAAAIAVDRVAVDGAVRDDQVAGDKQAAADRAGAVGGRLGTVAADRAGSDRRVTAHVQATTGGEIVRTVTARNRRDGIAADRAVDQFG